MPTAAVPAAVGIVLLRVRVVVRVEQLLLLLLVHLPKRAVT
jgi:hypothetical protein